MEYYKILEELGHLGRFQAFIFFLACFAQLFIGSTMLANVFLLGVPKYRCYVPTCDNSSSQYHADFTNLSIPADTDENGKMIPTKCKQYELITGKITCAKDSFNTHKTVPCSSYVFDHSIYEDTAVSDFNMVCSKAEVAVAQSSFMAGLLVGSVTFGIIADKFGRKIAALSATVLFILPAISVVFAQSSEAFIALRFLSAIGVYGLYLTTFILATEYVGISYRLVCANAIQTMFPVGELVLALCAYYLRSWRKLELVLSVPAICLLSYYWLLSESVRWLLSKGKYERAKEIIFKMAKCNKITLSEELIEEIPPQEQVKASVGPLDLLKTPILRMWSLNIFFNWLVNSLVYYGLSLDASNISSDIYMSFALLAATEIPGDILATVALFFKGRRPVQSSIMIFSGIACLSSAFIPAGLGWLKILLAVLGKGAIAGSFTIIYIYSAEIFPTALRSTGVGLGSMFARLGAIFAPFVNYLGTVYSPLPMILFGLLSLVAGVMVWALPETHNKRLPDSIEESEKLT